MRTEQGRNLTSQALTDLRSKLETYFASAEAAGHEVRPDGGFGGHTLCLVGAVCRSLGKGLNPTSREAAAAELKISLAKLLALELGFDSSSRGEDWAASMRARIRIELTADDRPKDLARLEALGRDLAATRADEVALP